VLEEPKWNGWMRMGGDDGKGMKNGGRREGFPMNPLLKTLLLLTQSPTLTPHIPTTPSLSNIEKILQLLSNFSAYSQHQG